jgi:deazaflavin-dependent oxidoreductase (nitroreductase family)
MRKSGSWPGVWWVYARVLRQLDGATSRMTGGKSTLSSWLTGLPIVQLTTTGAKSGARRTIPLVAIPEAERLVIIASNFGRSSHPAWYYNLKAHPRVTAAFEGRVQEMVAREMEGEERDQWYERGIAIYPGWVDYRTRTSRHRRIPVFELIPLTN